MALILWCVPRVCCRVGFMLGMLGGMVSMPSRVVLIVGYTLGRVMRVVLSVGSLWLVAVV